MSDSESELEGPENWEQEWCLNQTQDHLFLCLPPEMRVQILEYVDSRDCRSLRSVCALFKRDVEQILGLKVVLKQQAKGEEGPDPRALTQWLQSVIVRSLSLLYIGGTGQVPYAAISLKNPMMLHQLCLSFRQEDFSVPQNVEALSRTLNDCQSLRALHIHTWMEDLENKCFQTIFFEILNSLAGKVMLRDFVFQASAFMGWKLGGRGFHVVPDPAYKLPYKFPMKLHRLSLRLPFLSRTEYLDWKALLDTQDRLTTISIRVGLVGWEFFEGAIRKSARTLRSVKSPTLVKVHVAVPRITVLEDRDLRIVCVGRWIEYNWDEEGGWDPAEHPASFDWSILAQTALEELAVVRANSSLRSLSVRTHNFRTLSLLNLRKVNLHSIVLSLDDLTRIFLEPGNLQSLHISHWNLVLDTERTEFCLLQNLRIWILIAMVLQSRGIPYNIKLEDKSLARFSRPIVATVKDMAEGGQRIHCRKGQITVDCLK